MKSWLPEHFRVRPPRITQDGHCQHVPEQCRCKAALCRCCGSSISRPAMQALCSLLLAAGAAQLAAAGPPPPPAPACVATDFGGHH
eukprot:COSAG06_NODE_36019_length_452_cov_4.603399_1_plen_85_part_01